MKSILLITAMLLAFAGLGYAQPGVVDTHPNSSIFALDYGSGQLVPANSDGGILFKDAIIELVSNTQFARGILARTMPGPKTFIVTQLNPQTNGNAFQLVLQHKISRQVIYTFLYNADQNTLSLFNPQSQSYVNVVIDQNNINNLNNCVSYANFNAPPNQQPADASAQPAADADNTPVDADVTTPTAPPAMPDYEQPACPTDGLMWQPGYWAYSPGSGGYYWVPGVWVAAPTPGMLWTPPYWGFNNGIYAFNAGYWGPTVGFYGGINYGYGYGGRGFYGGEWNGGSFRYNTAVMRVNTTVVRNTYVDRTVIVNQTTVNHSSFNGQGGVVARPNPAEMRAAQEHHVMATPDQIHNQKVARADKSQFASVNGGKPANVAAARPPVRTTPANTGRTGSTAPRGTNNNGFKPRVPPKRTTPVKTYKKS
jgi:hypothetical protein